MTVEDIILWCDSWNKKNFHQIHRVTELYLEIFYSYTVICRRLTFFSPCKTSTDWNSPQQMGWETFGKCNNAYVQPFPPPNLSKILQLYENDKLLRFTIIYAPALKNIENYQDSHLFFNFFPSSFEAGRIIAL